MSPEVRDILNRDTQRIAHRFDALLARALPDLPDNIRRMRYIYFWTLTVQMFAGSGHLDSTIFGDLRTCVDEEALQRCFDYLVGGIEGPVTARAVNGRLRTRLARRRVGSDPLKPSLGARPAPSMAPDGSSRNTPAQPPRSSSAAPSYIGFDGVSDAQSCVFLNARSAFTFSYDRRRDFRMWKVTADRCGGASGGHGWPRPSDQGRLERPGAPISRHDHNRSDRFYNELTVCPPSTTTMDPVMYRDASEASKSSGPSRSVNSPRRRWGMRFTNSGAMSLSSSALLTLV